MKAGVTPAYVQRLVDLGVMALQASGETDDISDIRRVQLLHSWEEAGLSSTALGDLIRSGALSASWLDAAVTARAERLDLTYEEVCSRNGVPMALMRALQGALGFTAPKPEDRAREGDPELAALLRIFLDSGVPLAKTLGVIRVSADSLRRIAKAEAEMYASEFPRPSEDTAGKDGRLLEYSAQLGEVVGLLERALLGMYRRQREHACIDHCLADAEMALERAGFLEGDRHPGAICFVDLTGYSRITEERGDEVAAQLATSLASLVEEVARCHSGQPIRWLGDGGMFHFKEPGGAVLSGLDVVERAPRVGLPPMHIGIHTGPVIFQDGDVYGMTVNVASRIASYAQAGQVLASAATVAHTADPGVRFEPLGPVSFKGITSPVTLHRAWRPASV